MTACPDCAARTEKRGTPELCEEHRLAAYRGDGLYPDLPTPDPTRESGSVIIRRPIAEDPSVNLTFRWRGEHREATFTAPPGIEGFDVSGVDLADLPWYVRDYLYGLARDVLARRAMDGCGADYTVDAAPSAGGEVPWRGGDIRQPKDGAIPFGYYPT